MAWWLATSSRRFSPLKLASATLARARVTDRMHKAQANDVSTRVHGRCWAGMVTVAHSLDTDREVKSRPTPSQHRYGQVEWDAGNWSRQAMATRRDPDITRRPIGGEQVANTLQPTGSSRYATTATAKVTGVIEALRLVTGGDACVHTAEARAGPFKGHSGTLGASMGLAAGSCDDPRP